MLAPAVHNLASPAGTILPVLQDAMHQCLAVLQSMAATGFHHNPAEDHQDLRHLKPRQGAPMTSRLQPRLAFGLIPAEAAVLCGCVSIDSQRLESQHFVSLDEVG
jgi:hypothetical protein